MDIRNLFFDRHDEIRPPWRMLIFVTLLTALSFAILTPLSVLRGAGKFVPLAGLLLALILASFLMTRYIHRKPFGAFGLMMHRSTLGEFVLGCGLGLVMMAGIFLIEYGAGFASVTGRGLTAGAAMGIVATAAVEFLLAAAIEEVLFRGYVFQVLIQWLTLLPAMAIMGVLFALAHGFNPGIGFLAYMNIGLVSLTLSLAYYKTRGLWLPIGVHFGWNFAQTTVFGFPTSGVSAEALSVFTLTQSGPPWLTGGGFGPEGGLLATVSIIAGTWFVLKSRFVRTEEGIVTLDSLEDVLGNVEEPGGTA